MGRYHFLDEEEDDDDETDHHRHPIIPQTSRSHGSREEGEIIEDDSDEYENRDRNNNYEHEHENENEDYGDMDIDEDDERKDEYKYKYKYKYNSPQSNKYDIDGYEDTNHEDYDDDDDDDGEEYRGRRPLSSYLPSFSGLTGRGSSDQSRYGGRNRSPSPSPSPGPSSHRYYYNEHRNKENVDNESSSGSSDDEPWKHTRTHLYPEHNGNGNMNSNSSRKAYRLIGSSKYDRNYDHEDFYSPNHSSSPVSDDERETTPGRNLSSTALVHRSKHQQQQQLSSPQPQPSSSTRPEIHYHIYVSENQASRWFPSQQEQPTVEEGEEATTAHHHHRHHSPVQLWKKLTLLAGATQLLWMVLLLTGFGGPLESLLIHTNTITPPPPYLTWDEYGWQQWNLARRVSSEGYALGRHLLRTASLRDGEDTEASDGNDRPTYRFPETWWLTSSLSSLSSLSTSGDNQNHNSSDNDNNSDSNSIPLAPTALHWLPGQDRAVRQLQPRLNAWSSYGRQQPQPSRIPTQVPPRRGSFPRHPTSSRVPLYSSYSSHSHSATPSAAPSSSASSSSSSISSSSSPRSPLVIYASGGKGVGKRSLAYLLLQQLETSTTGAGTSTGAGANTNRKSAWEACKDVWSHQSRDEEDNNTPEGFRAQQQQQEQQQQRSYCPLLHLTPSDYHDSSTGEYGNGYDSDYSQTVADGINNNGDGDGDSDGNASVSSPLYRKILDHVVTAGGGASIVLLERVDCIVGVGAASGAVGASSFPEDCPHGGSATNPHQRSDWLSDLTALLKSQPAVFGNTIVVITSRVGTATAEKWTRKRLQQQQQQQSTRAPSQSKSQSSHHDAGDESWLADEVRSLVKYELRRYHSTDENDDDETRRLDDWWVLPLAPIERDGMGATLDRMAASGGCGEDSIAGFAIASASASEAHRHHDANDNKNSGDDETADADDATTDSDTDTLVPEGGFLLTRRASDAILDRLEWHQWIHKSTGAVLRVWSPDGADSLKDLWKHRILPRLSNALVSGCGAPPGDANQNEQNENEQNENEHEQNEKGDVYDDDKKQRRLLLDADEESSHTTDRWVLRSCVVASTTAGEDEDNAQQQDSEGSSFVTTTDGRRWNCQTNGSEWNEHACRFYL